MKIYCGDGGQYGPFDTQEDGWPNAGQVMRYFREKLGITAKALGIVYGEKIRSDKHPVCERWVLEMELENKVPVDITRRRTIAQLLNIPPTLLGLAALEDVSMHNMSQPVPIPTKSSKSILKRIDIDPAHYRSNILLRWQLHETSTAQEVLNSIEKDISVLKRVAEYAQGDLLYHANEFIFNNRILESYIANHRDDRYHAYQYANQALLVAEAMKDPELIATAYYTRGFQSLIYGLYGVLKNGRFVLNEQHLQNALHDFEKAKEGAHPQLQGLIATQLSRAQAPLRMKKAALSNLDVAADMVGEGKLDDLYTRLLVTGTFTGFHEGRHLTERATALNAIGHPGQALQTLNKIKMLETKTYSKMETRRWSWIDIVTAESYVGLEQYPSATEHLKKALLVSKDVHAHSHIKIIKDMCNRIMSTSYGTSVDAKELRDMLLE